MNITDSIFLSEDTSKLAVILMLKTLVNDGRINESDYHFACFIAEEVKNQPSDCVNFMALVAARINWELSRQNTCFNLDSLLDVNWLRELSILNNSLPNKPDWPLVIERSDCFGEGKPLYFVDGLVFLSRYYFNELKVAEFINEGKAVKPAHPWLDGNELAQRHDLNLDSSIEFDWQQQAVLNSLRHRFSVITGGPGTGKTTTVIKLLAALISKNKNLSVALAAPTGKAALRLTESLLGSLTKIDLNEEVKKLIPTDAMTIHRLLKPLGRSAYYYNEHNKLPIDVLILDEASMVDLSLMSTLISALPQHCQLVLLGDKQQLSSVEAGNLLAELCMPLTLLTEEQQKQPMYITELKKSYRFDAQGGIGLLAKSVNLGKSAAVDHLLMENCLLSEFETGHSAKNVQSFVAGNDVLTWVNPKDHSINLIVDQIVIRQERLLKKIKLLNEENENDTVQTLFSILLDTQLLACVRQGEYGVETLNELVKQRLAQKGLIDWKESHYQSRPILITENAYNIGLFNGDIGLQLNDPISGLLMSYFIDARGEVIKLFNQKLPAHESVYAMTVHKSQGSEFNHTLLVVPNLEQAGRVLTKQLIYTAITRAKQRFTVYGSKASILAAVKEDTERQSGLRFMVR